VPNDEFSSKVVNDENSSKLKAQVLHELGRSSMLKSSYDSSHSQILIGLS
jgi:hypothetical protein